MKIFDLGYCNRTTLRRCSADDANEAGAPDGFSLVSCVVWRTHQGESVSRVSTERCLGGLGDLEFVCNEAVLSRGRGLGIHKSMNT